MFAARYSATWVMHVVIQKGQAIVETLVLMLVLASMWVAIPWLAHLQDIALSATHASRHAAFVAARAEQAAEPAAMVRSYFRGAAHGWLDRRAKAAVDPSADLTLNIQRSDTLTAFAQPGGLQPNVSELRRGWGLEDTGVLRARLSVQFRNDLRKRGVAGEDGLLGLDAFDGSYPSIQRSTSILTGAGNAESDTQTQAITAASSYAWSEAQAQSAKAGAVVVSRAAAVDAGWSRAAPEFDWLTRWTGMLPEYLIVE